MKQFFNVALRNVLRNKRRTLLTFMVITLGITFVFTIRGFINGLQREFKSGQTKAELGEIQIVKKGFREALPAKSRDYFFTFTPELKKEILEVEHVTGVMGRLMFGGLINHQKSQTTTPFIAMGIDPVQENIICPRLKDMVKEDGKGKFLDANLERDIVLEKPNYAELDEAPLDDTGRMSVSAPKNLKARVDEYHQVLIGTSMVDGFKIVNNGQSNNAQIEDELILITEDMNHSQRSMKAHLRGVIDMPNPTANKSMIYVMLKSAQDLTGAQDMVTQLVIGLDDTKNRFKVTEELNKKLDKYGLVAQPWDDINKFFSVLMNLQNVIFSIIMTVIMTFVIVAIAITMFMTVTERTREIGTLMAIGYQRKFIVRMFLIESGIIGLMGGAGGLIMGFFVVGIFGLIGIPFTVPGTSVPIVIYPYNTWLFAVLVIALGILGGVFGALYPARVASKLSPLEALVHI